MDPDRPLVVPKIFSKFGTMYAPRSALWNKSWWEGKAARTRESILLTFREHTTLSALFRTLPCMYVC